MTTSQLYCPHCGSRIHEVSVRTIHHHIRQPWLWQAQASHYFHCGNVQCDLVYWGDDGSELLKTRLREDASSNDLVCYCFGVSGADLRSNPEVRNYLVTQTRERQCACEIRNPAGRCCLTTGAISIKP